MEILAQTTTTAVINAPLNTIHLPEWLFTLTDEEYQACSTDHIGAGSSAKADGNRISVNVEKIADNMLIQHYREEISQPAHCLVNSLSHSFAPMGVSKLYITWELKLQPHTQHSCTLFNSIQIALTSELSGLLQQLNITDLTPVKNNMLHNAQKHNQEETPFFARDIERKARSGVWIHLLHAVRSTPNS